jgi:molecular chaperone GrpE
VTDKASNGEAKPSEVEPAEVAAEGAAASPAQAEKPPEPDPLEEARQEAARLKDQLLRTLADFDNFRKRSRREITDAERKAKDDLLRDLLPVFDNIERAASHVETATDVQSVGEGIRMVLRQFTETLGKLGVERISTVGKPFDPAVHEAIQQIETAELAPGTVAHEIQGGYRTQDRLIRPAMVVVAKAKAGDAPS